MRTIEQRRADAFVELVTTGTIGGQAPAVDLEVTVDAETLVADADGACSIAGKYPISAETARRLGCDAALTAMVTGPNGEVLDVGRRQRTIPRRLRRALQRRDRGCVVDGCPRDGHLHAHHVVFWSQGGPTSLDNLVLLCSFHHRLVHQGVLTVELVDGRPTCRKADRSPRRARVAPPLDQDTVVRELERLGVPVELRSPRADGDRLDWDAAFAGLASLFDRAERDPALVR